MKDINALQDDISDIHSKQSALTNSSSMSNELQQIIGIGTGGVPPPPHKFLVCATPTLYALYYKLIVPPPQPKSLSYASANESFYCQNLNCCQMPSLIFCPLHPTYQ